MLNGAGALQGGGALPPAAEQAVEDAAVSRNTDLQQRALELQALLRYCFCRGPCCSPQAFNLLQSEHKVDG